MPESIGVDAVSGFACLGQNRGQSSIGVQKFIKNRYLCLDDFVLQCL